MNMWVTSHAWDKSRQMYTGVCVSKFFHLEWVIAIKEACLEKNSHVMDNECVGHVTHMQWVTTNVHRHFRFLFFHWEWVIAMKKSCHNKLIMSWTMNIWVMSQACDESLCCRPKKKIPREFQRHFKIWNRKKCMCKSCHTHEMSHATHFSVDGND